MSGQRDGTAALPHKKDSSSRDNLGQGGWMDPQQRSERFEGKKKLLAQSGMERRFLILPSLGLNTLSSILAPRVLIMAINFLSEQCLCSDG